MHFQIRVLLNKYTGLCRVKESCCQTAILDVLYDERRAVHFHHVNAAGLTKIIRIGRPHGSTGGHALQFIQES